MRARGQEWNRIWVVLMLFSAHLSWSATLSETKAEAQQAECSREWIGPLVEKVKQYEKEVRLKPDDAEARSRLGAACSVLGRWEEAQREFKEAVRLKPEDARAHYGLGVAYLALGNQGGALHQYDILKNLQSTFAEYLLDRIRGKKPTSPARRIDETRGPHQEEFPCP